MITKIQKWGNSLALRVPKAFADSLRLGDGSAVTLDLTDDSLVITKVPSHFSIDALGMASVKREKVDEWKRATWQLVPTLAVGGVDPPAVQWALLDDDPVMGFRDHLEERRSADDGKPALTPAPAESRSAARALASVAWNLQFRSATADQVGLLVSAPDKMMVYSTNSAKERVWFATKPVEIDSRVLAWSFPMRPEIGSQDSVELNLGNAIDLTSIVDEVIAT